MPNSTEHLASYQDNKALLTPAFVTAHPRWSAVIAFYAAVHLIERLATREPKLRNQHHSTHAARESWLDRHKAHRPHVYTDYIVLRDASETARYGTLNQFHQAHGATVQTQLIDICLAKIEAYVTAQFAPPAPPGAAGSYALRVQE